jgi:hypothetical protein
MAAAAGSSRFQAFMNHPAGPRTGGFISLIKDGLLSILTIYLLYCSLKVFFWAPIMKWCLVAAGLKDLSRPAEKLSISQNAALAATGFIWVRYSLVITPINYSLAAVNACVGCIGATQIYRRWE